MRFRDMTARLRAAIVGWVGPVAVLLAIAAAASLITTTLLLRGSPGWGYDFEAYLLAALRLGRGDSLYLPYTLAGAFRAGPFGLYLYAPPLGALLLPVTHLSVPAATDLWFAARAVLFVGACAAMPVSRRIRLLTFAAAAASEPVMTDLNLGNVSLIVMFLCVVSWRWLDRPAGSIAVAIGMSVRPTLGLFLIWWLLRRRLAPVAWALAAGAVLILVTLPIVGIGGYADYVDMLRNLGGLTGVANNVDLGSSALQLGLGQAAASVALFAGYAIAVVAVILSLRRDRGVGFMVTLGATLLLSPLMWDHYLVNLLLPAAFLAHRGRTWALLLPLLAWLPAPSMPILAVGATLLPFLARPIREASAPAARYPAWGETEASLRVDSPALPDEAAGEPVLSNRTTAPTATAALRSVPAGSSTTPAAPRTGMTSPVHGRSDSRTAITLLAPAPSGAVTNSASIGKRMKNMWMLVSAR